MIQLLIDYESDQDFKDILDSFGYQYSKVNEMIDAWLVLIEPEDVTELETSLKLPPLRMSIIGSYAMNGEQYIWFNPMEIQRNHSINKYKNSLKDIIEYDNEGNETGSHRPTDAEALNTQCNLIYGHPKRQLA